MRKALQTLLLAALICSLGSLAWADDCVEVDVELPATLEPLEMATGYFEIVNCGDEAAVVDIAVSLEFNGTVIEPGSIPIPMNAGQVISREFVVIAPPVLEGTSVTVCLSAVSGTAEASDCATTVIESAGLASEEGSKTFGFKVASETDCVEIDLELPDTVVTSPPDFFADGYFELTNCGDEAETVYLDFSFVTPDTTFDLVSIPVMMAAGQVISRELHFPVPPAVPPGEYTICITATAGEASATTCQTVVVESGGIGGVSADSDKNTFKAKSYPNPFNPVTTISFELPKASQVKVSVFNILGQEVDVLVDGTLGAGAHEVDWNGTNSEGQALGSGVYFYRIATDEEVYTEKMSLVK